MKIRQKANPPGNAPMLSIALITEQNRASIAGAGQFPAGRFDQVLMVFGQFGAAQLATLHRRPLADEAAERGE